MDEFAMIDLQNLPLVVILPACLLGGVVLGFAYFRAMRATTDMLVQGRSPLLGLALTLGRLAMLGGAFYLAVRVNGLALLAALTGVLIAKAITLRRVRGAGA